MNILDKAKKLKEDIQKEIPKITDKEITSISCKLSKWQYKSLKQRREDKLSDVEFKVFEFFKTKGYNPATVYKWFLLKNSHPELREMLRNKEIGLRNAFKLKKRARHILKPDEQALRDNLIELIGRYILQ